MILHIIQQADGAAVMRQLLDIYSTTEVGRLVLGEEDAEREESEWGRSDRGEERRAEGGGGGAGCSGGIGYRGSNHRCSYPRPRP